MTELHAVLLAAGGSSRLGRAKQLLEFRGETLVHRSARLLLECTSRVTVVTGARGREVARSLEGLGVQRRHYTRWREGMGGSLALAARGLEPGIAGALVLLCDQYLVDGPDLAMLVAAWRDAPERIAVAAWDDRFGPPVIFPADCFAELSRLRGDRGARQLLVARRGELNRINMPHAAYDIDTPADLAAMRELPQG